LPAQVLARRGAAGAERAPRGDVARRTAAASGARLHPARGVAPAPLPRAPGDDRALAGVRADRALVRRPRPARLLLPRELVDLARHHDSLQDAACRAGPARRLLRPGGPGSAAASLCGFAAPPLACSARVHGPRAARPPRGFATRPLNRGIMT